MFWLNENTFQPAPASYRHCVEGALSWLDANYSEATNTVNDKRRLGSLRCLRVSVNGLRINPKTCDASCLVKGLKITRNPDVGDVVVFVNNNLGLYGPNGSVFVLAVDLWTGQAVDRGGQLLPERAVFQPPRVTPGK